jgi:hypothetical protein
MRIIFLATICALASLVGCNMESKKASEYKGDGRIEYLPAPPLGISGWRVEFPHFDLSKGIEKTYDCESACNNDPPLALIGVQN